LKHIILPKIFFYRIIIWQNYRIKGNISFPITVSKFPGPSVSPPFLFSENSVLKVLQTDINSRRDVAKLLSWVTAGHQSAPVGLEWLSLGLKFILTSIDLGKMIIDPRPSSKRFGWTKSTDIQRMEVLDINKNIHYFRLFIII
jgi:hypothetical protein